MPKRAKWSGNSLIFYEGTTDILEIDFTNDTVDLKAGDGKFKINGTAVTSTAAELNILDGVTSTAAELNTLDGVTSTAAELNLLDGQGLDGTPVKNVANANVIGGIPVVHRIDTAGGATANTDVTLTHKTRVLDAWVVLRGTGTASDTVQITDGTNAITDAMAVSGADTSVVRAGTIDDAYHEVAAAGTLRVTETDGGGNDSPACSVYVLGVRVA